VPRTIPPPLEGSRPNGKSTQAKAWARFSHRFAVNPTDTQGAILMGKTNLREVEVDIRGCMPGDDR
jgi:hypothetical protein